MIRYQRWQAKGKSSKAGTDPFPAGEAVEGLPRDGCEASALEKVTLRKIRYD